MTVVALLSWWDENPAWLTRAIVPLARFCTHLIAVDGAYMHINGSHERPRSPGDQADAVSAACDGTGLGLTMHRPVEPWAGDEVAKRSFMFRLADLVCTPGDWLFVVDADEMVAEVPGSLHAQLEWAAEGGFEAATVDVSAPPVRGVEPARRFFLWQPGLRVAGRHFHYHAGPQDSPRLLWGNGDDPRLAPAAAVEGFRFEHWTQQRHPFRREAQLAYYQRRKQLELEHDV